MNINRKLKSCVLFFGPIIFNCVIWGCSKDNSESVESYDFPQIESVHGKYLFSKEEHTVISNVGGTAFFQFNGNRPSKRIGGYLSVPTAGGFSGLYTSEIYDIVQYNPSNTITLLSKDYINAADIPPGKREIIMKNGLIIQKITYDEVTTQLNADTMHYLYDTKKRLIKTEQYFKHAIINREFTFDTNDNLQRIYTVKKSRINDLTYYTMEELFGGYDNKPNPLKGQTLWPDLLYRTLSKNNFTTYSFTSGTNAETKNWTLTYNNGNVDFSK